MAWSCSWNGSSAVACVRHASANRQAGFGPAADLAGGGVSHLFVTDRHVAEARANSGNNLSANAALAACWFPGPPYPYKESVVKKNLRAAFTLVELLVVIAIIGVL